MAVSFFTIGRANNKLGKAINQESPQALNHNRNWKCSKPRLFNLLIQDTIQVMKIDNNSGITMPLNRTGSFLKIVVEDIINSVSWSIRQSTNRPCTTNYCTNVGALIDVNAYGFIKKAVAIIVVEKIILVNKVEFILLRSFLK
jgi:hypothetical protein